MYSIGDIRKNPGTIVVVGAHKPIIQAILDFDYASGKKQPSVVALITATARFQKYFWGNSEVLIPCFPSALSAAKQVTADWMLNISSGRRAQRSTIDFFEAFPNAKGGHIFAEDVPETHALALYKAYPQKLIVGPAGVGLVVPGALKLGAIGGVDWRQVAANHLETPGNVAVLSASGGMVNEIITMVAQSGHAISFSLCFGGDRFPIVRPRDAVLMAQADPATEQIVYYGELGGTDEYELAELLTTGAVTKPVLCYIAGVIGESFEQPVQFGHAKALAGTSSETASAKRAALKKAGATVAGSMVQFSDAIKKLPVRSFAGRAPSLDRRTASLFTATISGENQDGYVYAGTLLQDWARHGAIAEQIATALLGRRPHAKLTVDFIEKVFLLSVDHGPQVSGALTTIITARAGKGLVDSLAAGLLTVGPRFGGAVSDAAREWFDGVANGWVPVERVEQRARAKEYIGGIGHKKYRLGMPDPRVDLLATFATKLTHHPHYTYAREVEKITSAKKGTLILNVDGVIAALMLDILLFEEKLIVHEVDALIKADFFNALFVIPRTVGFISHYLDQKRLDEGLFRLPDDDVLLLG